MSTFPRSCAVALVLAGCGAATPAPGPAPGVGRCAPGETAILGHDVSLVCLEPDVWVFTALAPPLAAIAGYPANGLVVEAADHAVLVDTGWIPEQAAELLDWAAARARPVTGAMVTHFHDDRIGGAGALAARGIPVYALNEAADRAAALGTPFEHVPLEPGSVPELTWMYPGPGHSPENVVVFHPPSRTLFGGCFVKEARARDLGNVADADLVGWRASLDLVIESYPDLAHVVPGHGAVGDASLLHHTRDLLAECHADTDCAVTIETLRSCSCCSCSEPRAMAVAAIELARSQILSCEPICDGAVCPACTSADELARLGAACVDGLCAIVAR